jgi:prepilin-type N-terminal cleavage/methylation domain-containing protein
MTSPQVTGRKRAAFTLVELLVVIVIIGMLASMSLATLVAVRSSAREARTEALIEKLDQVVTDYYESYRTRRSDIDSWKTMPRNPRDAAVYRLAAIREIMRMEMPCRWEDVRNDPRFHNAKTGRTDRTFALREAYRNAFTAAQTRLTNQGLDAARVEELLGKYASAECLYLIVTYAIPESREMFNERDIGDADQDGLLEFHDGWGNPIYFLRWAPAFTESDRQPNIIDKSDVNSPAYTAFGPTGTNVELWQDPYYDSVKQAAAEARHDPFDPARAATPTPIDGRAVPSGWLMVPLIVSAGPDGIFDLVFNMVDENGDPQPPPYKPGPENLPIPAPYKVPFGMPEDMASSSVFGDEGPNGILNHYDNIHNHSVGGQ